MSLYIFLLDDFISKSSYFITISSSRVVTKIVSNTLFEYIFKSIDKSVFNLYLSSTYFSVVSSINNS